MGSEADALTFFVGSLWFTSAAFLQVVESANVDDAQRQPEASPSIHLLAWFPRRIDWWATIVQFAGTLFFNATTFNALSASLTVHQLNRLVWAPDAFGSTCFLIASGLAWFEVCRAVSCWRLRSLPWWITALNLLGSIAFGVSAIASFVLPTTGVPINVALVNLGTFVGAGCFFIGAVLLLPERTQTDSN